ncbi:MAG: hypothetical protein WC749_00500 [Dehalococcoidia bacterium]|uniref:hypothetical protein n=1 Tax=unclassified Pseudomonas TaxID=196821 RepID=UPI0014740B0B|nr:MULTISPECIES: hypothetical protein [unclassified Pseudomonas]NMX92572.1 hypothetical protein [Pseudomonas sp. WS 5086]NMY47149.1 hypothetical protein [Pseudomonas sp. WS 5027]
MIDINALFKEQLKKEQTNSTPKAFLIQVEKDPVHSPSNADVFKVIGRRMDTDERVVVVSVKSAAGQAVPKAGDIMRADKVVRDPAHPNQPIFKAKYFHTYEQNGFCLNAVMQPLPVRKNEGNGMVGAQVIAYDPKSSGSIISGAGIREHLTDVILTHLKQWDAKAPSGITHDVAGKPLWGSGATRGLTPMVTVRFADQSFKVFGAGAMQVDANDKTKGLRFPTDQELRERIAKTKGVVQLTNVVKSLIDQGASLAELQKVDISVVPGLVINVGRDQITMNERSGREYYSVPEAYQIAKEGGGSYAGHRETFIHVKMTRTNKLAVVDTAPAPGGKATPKVPLFANEIERIESRKNLSSGQQNSTPTQGSQPVQQSASMTREQALNVNDFPDEKVDLQTPVSQQIREVTSGTHMEHQTDQSTQFDPADYDLEGLDEDMAIIEAMNNDLGVDFNEVESLLQEADAISAQRNAPRMG